MALGGKRAGSGRKPGKQSVEIAEFRAYMRERIIAEKGDWITAQMNLARRESGAFKVLMDHAFGKPPEAIEHNVTGELTVVLRDFNDGT